MKMDPWNIYAHIFAWIFILFTATAVGAILAAAFSELLLCPIA